MAHLRRQTQTQTQTSSSSSSSSSPRASSPSHDTKESKKQPQRPGITLPSLRTLASALVPPLHLSLTSPFWTLIEHFYALPNPPPPRTRPRDRPMQVICVGLPRSGTESLQQALLHLGYDYTYHGWDIIYDEQCHSPGWVALARKKFYSWGKGGYAGGASLGNGNGQGNENHGSEKAERDEGNEDENTLTAADFDALLGHSVAVTDAAASVFAADMIAAYPDAKVVLNMRRDVDAWTKSLEKTLVHANGSWAFWLASWLDRECFWAWHVYERFLWPLLFRAPDGDMAGAIRRNARWIQREHSAMIRGLVAPGRLLEWHIEDGWEPLCAFLDKPVPDVPFPHANTASGGWKSREAQCNQRWVDQAFTNLIVAAMALVGFVVVVRLFL